MRTKSAVEWQSYRPRRLVRLALTLALSGGLLAGAGMSTAGAAPGDSPPKRVKATTEVVTSTGQSGNSVAFTFDDGPDPGSTPHLLDVLGEHNVTAVFCLWGDHVRQHPEIVRRIAAEGHVLCNHSMRHDDMGGWSAAQIRSDMQQTNALIRQAVPGASIPYFRAPYGSWGQTPGVAAQLGMQPLGWRMDIGDWQPPGTAELVRRLRDGITPGAVVLMHDGGGDRSQTVAAVDQVIPGFQSQGWSFDLPALPGG